MLPPLVGMFVRVSNDYGEGWSAYWSRTAVEGGSLYPVSNTLVANNYPPLFFLVDGYLGRLIGDNIFAGRILALSSMLIVAAIMGRILYLQGSPRRWALIFSLLFLVDVAVFFPEFVAVSNPQWPGQAVALSGLLFLIGVEPADLRVRSIVMAGAVMVVAGLIKHNQIALPLAVTIWLFRYNRRAFAYWCLSGTMFAAAAIGVLAVGYGPAIFIELVGFKRTVDLHNFFDGFVSLGGFGGLIIVAGAAVRPLRSDPRSMLLVLYAAIGLLSGLTQRLGAGVFLNAHFDGAIGVVLVCGTFLGRAAANMLPQPVHAEARSRWLLLISAPMLILAPLVVTRTLCRLSDIPRQQAAWTDMIARVRTARGPALCEMLAVCYWADRPMGIDFFAYGQRLRTGTDSRPLQRLIARREVAVLIADRTKHYLRGDGRLPRPLPGMIERNYAVILMANHGLALMIPRN